MVELPAGFLSSAAAHIRKLGYGMKPVVLFLAVLCWAAPAVFAAPPQQASDQAAAGSGDTVIEEIVARINNQIITRSELQRSREQMMAELRQQGVGENDPRLQEAQRNLLRDMIDQQLLVQKGQDLGISADTELVKRLDQIRKQMNLDSMDELEKVAQQQGVSYEDFKQNLRNSIITQQVISREVGSKIQITEDEEKQYYEEHQKEMEQPEQVRLSEILIPTQEGAELQSGAEDPQAVAAAEAKAQQVLAAIRGGAKFEDEARANSHGPTAKEGGDLGYFKRGSLAKELEDKTYAMKAGDVSDVIRTKQGFVILKVTEHQMAGLPPLKQVAPQIQEMLYMKKLQPRLREYLTKLREDAFIDLKPGFVDTGASPNQTKPILTAASSEPGRHGKLKRKKKLGIF
jgi:peptidyl-prolyl cis-trans isomerase SurA